MSSHTLKAGNDCMRGGGGLRDNDCKRGGVKFTVRGDA